MSTDTIKSPINLDNFEIVKTGIANFPNVSTSGGGAGLFASGEGITTVAHNLGYTPVVLAFVQQVGVVTNNFCLPSFSMFGQGTTTALWINLQVAADATNLYVISDMMSFGTNSSLNSLGNTCQYYLLRERIKRTS